MNMIPKLDSKLLRRTMYELGLSTYQVAAAAGLPQPTVSTIMLGQRKPSAERLKAICDVLDLDINDVFISDAEKMAA